MFFIHTQKKPTHNLDLKISLVFSFFPDENLTPPQMSFSLYYVLLCVLCACVTASLAARPVNYRIKLLAFFAQSLLTYLLLSNLSPFSYLCRVRRI